MGKPCLVFLMTVLWSGIAFSQTATILGTVTDSSGSVVPTATITMTNTGNSAKDFFADARRSGRVRQQLLGSDVNNVALPLSLSAQPNWLVPPDTKALTVAAKGTVPVTMDVSWLFGDPDVLAASSGHKSVATLAAPELAPGFFFGLPEATEPFTSPTTAKAIWAMQDFLKFMSFPLW